MGMRGRSAVFAALFVVPLLVVLGLGFGRDPHAVPSVMQGRAAPAFQLTTLGGEVLSLQSLRGRPVVLNFWSTWCMPCMAEHALLQEAAAVYGDRVQFLGAIYQDNMDSVRRYLRSREDRYPQLQDPQSRLAIDYGVAGVPETYFISASGTIVKKVAGVVSADLLRQTLATLLQVPPR